MVLLQWPRQCLVIQLELAAPAGQRRHPRSFSCCRDFPVYRTFIHIHAFRL